MLNSKLVLDTILPFVIGLHFPTPSFLGLPGFVHIYVNDGLKRFVMKMQMQSRDHTAAVYTSSELIEKEIAV